jgi:hypothetical protein
MGPKLCENIDRDIDTWDRCYDFLNIFAKKIQRKIWRFWLKTKLNYAKF